MTKINFPFSLKSVLKELVGKTLVDIYVQEDDYSISEVSDTCIVLFNDGHELNIYGNGKGTIFIESD